MWKPMPTGYPMMMPLNQKATSASVTARVPRPAEGSGDRLHVVSLIVEPGYISSEHVRPGTTSAAPRYIGAPAAIIATGVCFIMAFVFRQRWTHPQRPLQKSSAFKTLWRPLLPYGYNYKASYARPAERKSARMSKIRNDGLTRSGIGCFIALYPYGNSGRQRAAVSSVSQNRLSLFTCNYICCHMLT